MDVLKYLVAVLVAVFAGCSSNSTTAGNSAETGSPELAGILFLDSGQPAAMTKVQCVPQDYDASVEAALPLSYSTETDSLGYYRLDSLPEGTYSVEAFHEKSGKRLLVQGVKVTEDDSVAVNDTLRVPGMAELYVNDSVKDGALVAVTVLGTTILRETTVQDKWVLVDSLPAGTLSVRLYVENDTVTYDEIRISPGMTTTSAKSSAESPTKSRPEEKKQEADSAASDTVVRAFVAPLVLPEGVDTLNSFTSDIPLALRLDENNCDFEAFSGKEGRWEVVRISHDGNRSKKLPIVSSYFDPAVKEAVFWVNVDSLNVADSLELRFDSSMESAYATDVFPTNRSYSLVWHFDSGISPVQDDAEKALFDGTASAADVTDGVIGKGVKLDLAGKIVAENSAEFDETRKVNLVFDTNSYFCFSVWVQLENNDKEQTIFEKSKEYALRYDPAKGFVVDLWVADSVNYKYSWASGVTDIKAGEWAYVAFSRHTTSKTIFYVNDKKIETETDELAWGEVRQFEDFTVGGFAGKIDELMLGSCFRDDSWTRLTYLNQRPENYWPAFISAK